MPLFKLTGANGITAEQAGAPGASSAWKLANRFSVFMAHSKLFEEHIHTENQNLHYKLHCSFPKTPTTKTKIVRLIDQLL